MTELDSPNFSYLCKQLCLKSQPNIADKSLYLKKLQTLVYDILFEKQNGPHRDYISNLQDGILQPSSSFENLLSIIYELRSFRKFDLALNLEKALNSIKNSLDNTTCSVLIFVCKLSYHLNQETQMLGYKKRRPFYVKSTQCPFPYESPVGYEDTECIIPYNKFYMDFPKQIFEDVSTLENEKHSSFCNQLNHTVFTLKPDTNRFKSTYTQSNSDKLSLFGGLINSSSKDLMNVKLELPPLSEDNTEKMMVKRLKNFSQKVSDDEGYDENAHVGDLITPFTAHQLSQLSGQIWEDAIHDKTPTYYKWESRGKLLWRPSPLYLSESDPMVFDIVYLQSRQNLKLLYPNLVLPELRLISQENFYSDVINLLIAVPSNSFKFNEVNNCFELSPGTHLSGSTPESFDAACSEFVECGTNFKNLFLFSSRNLSCCSNLTLQAFSRSLAVYLQSYCSIILTVPPDLTLFQIQAYLSRTISQIKFLSELCNNLDSSSLLNDGNVLSYLYKEALLAIGSPNYPLLLYLLRGSCSPYLNFIQDWIYLGICSDICTKSIFIPNETFLSERDRRFWTDGHTFNKKNADLYPLFLKEIIADVFLCGKSVNLLKLCKPEHYLFSTEVTLPRIHLRYSEDHIDNIYKQNNSYYSHIQSIGDRFEQNRLKIEALQRSKKEKTRLIAKERTAREIKRIKENQLDQKRFLSTKKKKLFQDFKSQLLKAEEEKNRIKQLQKQVDLEEIKQNNYQQLLETKASEKLKSEVRHQIIQKYNKLIEEADKRKEHAMWRIKRHQLNATREKYLETLQSDQNGMKPDYSDVKPVIPVPKRTNSEVTVSEIPLLDKTWVDQKPDSKLDVPQQNLSASNLTNSLGQLGNAKNSEVFENKSSKVSLSTQVDNVHVTSESTCKTTIKDTLKPSIEKDFSVKSKDSESTQIIENYSNESIKPPEINPYSDIPSRKKFPLKHVSDESLGLLDSHLIRPHRRKKVFGQSATRTSAGHHNSLPKKTVSGNSNNEDTNSAHQTATNFICHMNVLPYDDTFNQIEQKPNFETSTFGSLHRFNVFQTEFGDSLASEFLSLPSLINTSILTPIAIQVKLVNQCIKHYFFTELNINECFEALYKFFLLEDGEFSQSISSQLLTKLARNPRPNEMLNPSFLNHVLSQAVEVSTSKNNAYADKLSFSLKSIPAVPFLESNSLDSLSCLDLTMKIEWPLNIIISDECVTKYQKIFSFMIQLKRAAWTLTDVWHKLKRDALILNASNDASLLKFHIYRHEMQHFIHVMQGYISNQIIHVSWQQFQTELSTEANSVDQLYHKHNSFTHKCISRCLLDENARPVMNIIQNNLKLILKFHTQLHSVKWEKNAQNSTLKHPAYLSIRNTYSNFCDFSRILFNVLKKLVSRGYQPHLEDLLLRLDFNNSYESKKKREL